jgi:hypothetical protein
LSYEEQNFSSDEKENVGDNRSMQHGIRAKSGVEWPCLPFTGKPGINVDLEDPVTPWSILSCSVHQKLWK